MLTDTDAARQIAQRIQAQDASLWEKIVQWFKDFEQKLRSAYNGLKPGSGIAKEAKKALQQVDGLVKMWADMAVDSAENYREAANEKEAENAVDDNGVKYQARRLNSDDISEYLMAGDRENRKKISALNEGKKLILTSENEITEYIDNAIDRNLKSNHTVAYGKVNDRLAQDVFGLSNGKIKISNHFLELIPDNLQHAYEQHSTAKQDGDIALDRTDFERIPEYLDSYTEIVYAIKYSSGKVGVCVSKKLPNGRILLIETVSKSRGALQFKNAIGVSEEKYKRDYVDVYKKRVGTNTGGSESSNNSPHDESNSKSSIRNSEPDVNQKISDQGDTESDFYDAGIKCSARVTDDDTLSFLNSQKTIKTYKTMQVIDGKLYPPMAARVDGKHEDYSELGAWEQATEHPELIKGNGKFKLDKGKGQGSLEAAYNPYMHSSNLVLNDQFSGAYTRDNLVTVECEVPVSELDSGYHAQYAKDSVGWHAWHTGTVAGSIRKAKGIERQVFLSRWIKPVRIVPDAEVASMYKELLSGTDIAVPDNVVTPSLLSELKKAGVKIEESGRVKYSARDFQRDSGKKLEGQNSSNPYSYESLTAKPDMAVTTLPEDVPKSRADVVYQAKQNAAKIGKFNTKDGSVSVHVKDIGKDVVLGTPGLKHSLDRRLGVNAPVVLKAGEIIENSIRINEMTAQKPEASESYVLIGAARNNSGELYVVRSVVNRFSNELSDMDILYAINAKKEPAALLPRVYGEKSAPSTGSTISIAELLDNVNEYFPDILPEDVLRHFGHESRPEGKLGESALYSSRKAETEESHKEELAKTRARLSKEAQERRENILRDYQKSRKISVENWRMTELGILKSAAENIASLDLSEREKKGLENFSGHLKKLEGIQGEIDAIKSKEGELSQQDLKKLTSLEQQADSMRKLLWEFSEYDVLKKVSQKTRKLLMDKYGSIKPGENPSRQADIPIQTNDLNRVSQTVRTAVEASATSDEMAEKIRQKVVEGEFSYLPITDDASNKRAEETINRKGWDDALDDWIRIWTRKMLR